jgi:D-psicose/D-tagatose/L-ribulose 3-epimerase
MAIKFGINTFTWTSPFTTEDLPLLDKAKEMGFDLVEIPIENPGDVDYDQAAEAFKRTGLACGICAVMGASRDPAHEDESIQRGGVEYLMHCIDATAKMGGKVVGGPIYAAVGRTWQSTPGQRKIELERCAKNLREAGKYAEDRGVVLAMEPLNRFETSFINLAEQAVELVEMVDSPAVKIMLDTFHMNVGDPWHWPRSLGRSDSRLEEDRLRWGAGHRVLHHVGQRDCQGSGYLATSCPQSGYAGQGGPGIPQETNGLIGKRMRKSVGQ